MSGFVEVLPPELTGPDHPEWFEARRAGVTASEIAAVMGLAPRSYGSAFKLYWQKVGALGEDPDERRTRWGRRLERHIADEFAAGHPEFQVAPAGLYAHKERPWQMASPDRLIWSMSLPWSEEDDTGPITGLECKAWHSWEGWGDEGTDEVPVHIRCQALWQADVLQVPCVYVAVANGSDYREYVIQVDKEARADLTLMREAAEAFLDRIARGDPPDVDGSPATLATLKALHPSLEDTEATVPHTLAQRYRSACRTYGKAKDRKKLIENQLRDRMGRARVAVDPHGEKVATRLVYDRKPYEVGPSHIDYLTPAKEQS